MEHIATKNLSEAFEGMLVTNSNTQSRPCKANPEGVAIIQKLRDLEQKSAESKQRADAILSRPDWRKEEQLPEIPVDVMTTGPGLRIVRGYAALNKESQQLQPDDIKSSGESGTVTLVPLMIDDYVPLVIESFTIPQKELLARL